MTLSGSPAGRGWIPAAGQPVNTSRKRPDAGTLHRLYVVQRRPLSELTAKYRVDAATARQWLLDAQIAVRPARGGRRAWLSAPAVDELRRLVEQDGLPVKGVAQALGVSPATAGRWLREAGISVEQRPRKNRPRGAAKPMSPPSAGELRCLYVDEELSVQSLAIELRATPHLVRTWLTEAGIRCRPGGGRKGVSRVVPIRKPPPPPEELRRLWLEDGLSQKEIAARRGVHPATVSKWLSGIGLAGPRPVPVPASELVDMYETDGLTAAEIARRVGLSAQRVLQVLHDADVQMDKARPVAAVRAAAARRPRPPALPEREGDWAERQYRVEGWSYRRIGDALGRPPSTVSRELRARGLKTVIPRIPGRGTRVQAPLEAVEDLYVEAGWSAKQVGQTIGVHPRFVLRTGHANGLPIRQGGRPRVPTGLCMLDALYNDPEIARVLAEHAVPHRPATGDIADRFPIPVPLTSALLTGLYDKAGCSSPQVELLTGQSQAVIRARLREWGIALHPEHPSPAYRRLRADARARFHADVAALYRQVGSTKAVADVYGCAQASAGRWLQEAGVQLTGRGKWDRRHTRPGEPCDDEPPTYDDAAGVDGMGALVDQAQMHPDQEADQGRMQVRAKSARRPARPS